MILKTICLKCIFYYNLSITLHVNTEAMKIFKFLKINNIKHCIEYYIVTHYTNILIITGFISTHL